MRRLAFLLVLLLSPAAPASAARLSLISIANSSEPTQPGTEFQGKTTYGGGLLMELRMVPTFGIEVGAIYAPRKFSYSTTTPTTANYTFGGSVYEFPALLRLHMGKAFSFGVGGYYARGTGTATLDTEANGAKSSQSVSYASQLQAGTDYGIATSLALTMRIGPLTHLLFDGRYLIGLKNTSLSGNGTRKFNDMEMLAGLQFGF